MVAAGIALMADVFAERRALPYTEALASRAGAA